MPSVSGQEPRSCRPPSMKSRRNEHTTARSVGTSRQRLSSSKTSRPDAPIRAHLVGTSRVEHHDLTFTIGSVSVTCGGRKPFGEIAVPGDPSRRARPCGSGASANQDVARRQAPQRNTTVNARRIACVNGRVALKRFTVDTTSRSQRSLNGIGPGSARMLDSGSCSLNGSGAVVRPYGWQNRPYSTDAGCFTSPSR